MKKIGLLIFTVLLSVSAYSQFGIKAGVDYGTLAGHDASTYRWGFHGGFTYDFQLSEKLYIQPAVMGSLHSFGLKEWHFIDHGKVNKFSVEVPVNLSFRPQISYSYDVKLVIDFGPYIKYGFAGDKFAQLKDVKAGKTDVKGSAFDHSFNNGYKGETALFEETDKTFAFNRIDFGLNAGIGVEVTKIYAGISYQYGFLNGEKNNSVHNSIFRFSLGYRF